MPHCNHLYYWREVSKGEFFSKMPPGTDVRLRAVAGQSSSPPAAQPGVLIDFGLPTAVYTDFRVVIPRNGEVEFWMHNYNFWVGNYCVGCRENGVPDGVGVAIRNVPLREPEPV